jgi:anti-anti-sigma factor
MIRGLGDDVVVDAADGGTTVRFALRLAAPATGPAPAAGPAVDVPAEVRVSEADAGRCVQVRGDLDLAGAAAVRERLLAAVAERGTTLDLTAVGTLSSVGMGLLVEAVGGARPPLRVLLPTTGPARRALDLTGLTPLLAAGAAG